MDVKNSECDRLSPKYYEYKGYDQGADCERN